MTAVLDAGALIAIDRRDRRVGAMVRVLQEERVPLRTSAGVVGQVWRDGARQANLARMLAGVAVTALDVDAGKRCGELLKQSGLDDVIDAHVSLLVAPGDRVLTTDPDDIGGLLKGRGVDAVILSI